MRQAMLKFHDTFGGQNPAVSDTRSLYVTGQTLIAAQVQNRSAPSTAKKPIILHSHLVFLENCLHHHQGSSLDAMS